jgi:hypothetical protein
MSDTSSGDSFTATTTTSWLTRIKNAFTGIVAGFVLVGAGCFLLFWNEGRAVQTAKSLAEGGKAVVSVDAGRVDPANEGRLIHVSGPVRTGGPVMDSEFGISTRGVRLVRTVEMFQWREEKKTETKKNLGGSEETITTYTYRREWHEGREDSSRFHRPDGHRNPEPRYQRRDLVSSDATIGAFRPGEAVLRQISARDELRVDPSQVAALRGRINGPVQAVDGRIFLGAYANEPQVGDLRISYRVAQPEMLSVIGRQTGSGFGEYQTQAGDRLLMATAGSVPAQDMFKAAERENTLITWLVRLAGTFGVFLGFALVLRPLVVIGDFIPLIGSILGAGAGLISLMLTALVAPLVIAVAWFYYRPLTAILILAVGAAAAIGLKTLASRRASIRAAAASQTPAPAG